MNTKITKFFAVVICTLCANYAFSATVTWTGNNNTDWNTGANWSGGSVPSSSDDVVINNGSASNQPVLDASRTIQSISISAGTLDLSGNTLTVSTASFTGGTLKNGYLYSDDFNAMENANFEGFLVMYKTGGSDNDLNGGNSITGPFGFVNNSNSRLRLAATNADQYQGIAHFEENGSGSTEPAYNGNNTFAGDISSIGSTNTVTFGSGTGQVIITGTTSIYGSPRFDKLTVNTTGQISIQEDQPVTELRMVAGTLDLDNHVITATTAYFTGGNITDGSVNFANVSTMQNATFTGPLTLTKTGGSDNIVAGGNIFNDNVTIINSSSALLRMANTTGDDYNGNMNFRENGSGQLEPAFSGNNTFAGEISTANSTSVVSFGGTSGTGIVIIDGNTLQSLVGSTSQTPVIRKLTLNTTGSLYLNLVNLVVETSVSFTSGIITSFPGNELIFADNAIHTGAKNSSHVEGPVIKRGNDAFIFPVGDGLIYAPIEIGAPGNTSDEFYAEYVPGAYVNTTTLGSGLDHVSTQEHWILNRTNGTSNVTVTLHYNGIRSGGINQMPDLRVARWSGSQWVSHGNGATTGTNAAGTVVSSSAVTDFSPFTLGSSSTLNPLPVSLLNFDAKPLSNNVKVIWSTTNEINNDYFLVEKSLDGKLWNTIGRVEGSLNSDQVINYSLIDTKPVEGIQYYRLKQYDLNGAFEYSNIIPIRFNMGENDDVVIYPNPAGSTLNITLTNNDETSIRIFNSFGQVVLEMNSVLGTAIQVDLSDLASGVYNVEITNDGLISNRKIIKQ